MNKPAAKAYEAFESFDQFFQKAEDRPGYWVERAKLEFTREMLARMEQLGVSKSELARRLDVKPGLVTRLASGRNNFTLGTMVRIALALDSVYRSHLQPKGQETMWIDVLKATPPRPERTWPGAEFKKVAELIPEGISYERIPATT